MKLNIENNTYGVNFDFSCFKEIEINDNIFK